MPRACARLALLLPLVACSGTGKGQATSAELAAGVRRMPAEWEPQEAVWLQWPAAWEGRAVARSFVEIIAAVAIDEPVHLLVPDRSEHDRAASMLAEVPADRLTLHEVPTNSSWMRDNGPRYVERDGELVVQNWEFDGWGGAWGPASNYVDDNDVPDVVAELLELSLEQVEVVHERGDLEVNGHDTALVNWSVVSHRNPGQSREALTAAFEQALGVSSVIWAEGFHPADGTRGHIDGMARFVAEDTVLVGRDGSALMDEVAEQIATQRPDLRVERLDSPHAALFLNFLVGNGFVLVATSGDDAEDAAAAEVLQGHFPDREVRFADVDALWRLGGGIHCVTNDQPVAPG
jgi:agmatine deiminase